MDPEKLSNAATPQEMAAAMRKHKDDLAVLRRTHHRGPSVREETYQGHHIRVVTTYDITVDGTPVTGHVFISNEGTVHYHAIANQEFASMIDMVKSIIDLSPELADSGDTDSRPGAEINHTGPDHAGHEHGEGS